MPLLSNSDFKKIQKLLDWQRKVSAPIQQLVANQQPQRRIHFPAMAVGGYQQVLKGTADADILENTTDGTITIAGGDRDGETLTVVFDWIDDEKISAGKEVIVARFKDEEPRPQTEPKTEIWRPVAAQCENPPPPDAAQIINANHLDTEQNNWSAVPGGQISHQFGTGYTPLPLIYGFEVHEPGYWRISFVFTAEGLSNNMTLEIRDVTDSGIGLVLSYPLRQADTTTSGTISLVAAVTQAELDAGQVFLVVERRLVSGNVTWISSELTISREGYGVPT